MANYSAPSLTAAQRMLLENLADRGVTRAAAIGLWPELAGVLSAIEAKPATLKRVPAPWVHLTLSLLEPSVAHAAATADLRLVTLDAAEQLGLGTTRTRPTPAAPEVEPADLATLASWGSAQMRGFLLHEADRVGELVAILTTFTGPQRIELTTTFVSAALGLGSRGPAPVVEAARDTFQALAWGQLGEVSPRRRNVMDVYFSGNPDPVWLEGAPALNHHAVGLLLGASLTLSQMAGLLDRLGLDPELGELLTRQGMQALWGPWRPCTISWLVADRALDAAGLEALDLTGHRIYMRDALELAGFLSPTLRGRLAEELRAGNCGTADYLEQIAPLRALVGEAELPHLLRDYALADWIETADTEALTTWATRVDTATSVRVFDFLAPDSERALALAELVAEHTPGVPSWILSHSYRNPDVLRQAVLARLSAALGDDAMAWQAAWTLLEGFPGNTVTAMATIQALQH